MVKNGIENLMFSYCESFPYLEADASKCPKIMAFHSVQSW